MVCCLFEFVNGGADRISFCFFMLFLNLILFVLSSFSSSFLLLFFFCFSFHVCSSTFPQFIILLFFLSSFHVFWLLLVYAFPFLAAYVLPPF